MFTAPFMFIALSPLGISIYSLPLWYCFYLFANICPDSLFLAEQTTASWNAPTFFGCVIIPTPFLCRARPGGAILSTQNRGAQSLLDSQKERRTQHLTGTARENLSSLWFSVGSLCPRVLSPRSVKWWRSPLLKGLAHLPQHLALLPRFPLHLSWQQSFINFLKQNSLSWAAAAHPNEPKPLHIFKRILAVGRSEVNNPLCQARLDFILSYDTFFCY